MGRPKGSTGTITFRTKEEKFAIIEPVLNHEISLNERANNLKINRGSLSRWIKLYLSKGIEGLVDKRKPGNVLAKIQRRKELTREEALEYELLKLKIENERLKKGYSKEEADRIKKQYKKNLK